MELSRELLFFFSALGAFNGVVIGLYFLLFAKPRIASNYFLGVLLLALSIRTGKSVFLYFNEELAGPFIQFGLSACLFIGPSLYFYLRSVQHPGKSLSDWKFHYVPLVLIITVIDFSFPWYENHSLWVVIFDSIYAVWFIYIFLSGWIIRSQLAKIFKKEKLSPMEIWINSIFIGNLLVWTVYNFVTYTSYILGALSFSFIFYLLVLLLIFTRKKDPGFLSRQIKYKNKKIEDVEVSKIKAKLDELMVADQLFKDPNLKLPQVANQLNLLPHTLSQVINDNLKKNFTGFINEYRIEFAKTQIAQNAHLKLESIGYESGFNSKSTFYSAFKKVTGKTPAQFKEDSLL